MRLKTAKSRTPSSQAWLERQLNDPFVAEAKARGFRSRAAFKLIEIDDRFHLIGKGAKIVDLGAAPGGWAQVAVKRGAAKVVGVGRGFQDGGAFNDGGQQEARDLARDSWRCLRGSSKPATSGCGFSGAANPSSDPRKWMTGDFSPSSALRFDPADEGAKSKPS